MINYDFGNKLEKDYQANINIYKKNLEFLISHQIGILVPR